MEIKFISESMQLLSDAKLLLPMALKLSSRQVLQPVSDNLVADVASDVKKGVLRNRNRTERKLYIFRVLALSGNIANTFELLSIGQKYLICQKCKWNYFTHLSSSFLRFLVDRQYARVINLSLTSKWCLTKIITTEEQCCQQSFSRE